MRRAGPVPLWIVLAFAKMGFNAIDERLFRTRDHEINLIKIRWCRAGGTWPHLVFRCELYEGRKIGDVEIDVDNLLLPMRSPIARGEEDFSDCC